MKTVLALLALAATAAALDQHLGIPTIKPGLKCEKLDLIFLIDDSQSVGPNNFTLAKNFVKQLVHEFSVDLDETRVALVIFNSHAHVQFRLRDATDVATVDRLVDEAQSTTGTTNTAEALQLIRTDILSEASGARINSPNVVVFISDGYHSENTPDPVPIAEQIRQTSNTTIISIGIAGQNGVLNSTRYRELIGISGAAAFVFNSSTYQHLDQIKDEIIQRFPCERPLRCAGDITFLIETSEKVGKIGVEGIKNAVIDMMSQLDITNRRTDRDHVALVHFSDPNSRTNVLFNMDNGKSYSELRAMVHNLQYESVLGVSDFRRGLRLVNEDVYDTVHDRPLQPNIVIIFAQGFFDQQPNCCDPPFHQGDILRANAELYSIILPPKKNYMNLARITRGDPNDRSRIFEFAQYAQVTQMVKNYLNNFNCIPPTTTTTTTTPSPPPPCHCPTVEQVVSTAWYDFESCNYPHVYSNDLDCEWYFTAPAGLVVEFMCIDFVTEFQADFVSVFDGRNINDQSKLLTSLSGIHQGNTPSTYSTDRTLSVLFHTDDTGVRKGWHCRVRSHVPPTPPPTPSVSPTFCNELDLIFVIDSSQSIVAGAQGAANKRLIREFLVSAARKFTISPIRVEISVVLFAYDGAILWQLNDHTTEADLEQAINSFQFINGLTNTKDGLQKALDVLTASSRPRAPKAVVLITDGVHTPNTGEPFAVADEIRARFGATVLAVGVVSDNGFVYPELLRIANNNPHFVFNVTNFASLGQFLDQIIAQFPCQSGCFGDITFIIETSELVGNARVEAQKSAAIAMMNELNIDQTKSHVAVVHFSSPDQRSGILVGLNQGTSAADVANRIRTGIDWSVQRGNTDLEIGLRLAAENVYAPDGSAGDRPGFGNVVVLMAQGFYDHLANCCPDPTAAGLLLQSRSTIFSLALGPNTDRAMLQTITGNPFHVYDFAQYRVALDAIKAQLANGQLCGGFTGSPTVTRTTTPITTTPTPTPTPTITHSPDCLFLDLVFVLDSSESVVSGNSGPANQAALKQFLVDTTRSFFVGSQRVQIGVILFNFEVRVVINLDQFDNQPALEAAIRAISFTTGITDTASGLRAGANAIHTHGRPNAPPALVLITDGFHSPNTDNPIPVAQSIRNSGITIVAVGVKGTTGSSDVIRYQELLGIAGRADHVFNVTDFTQLSHFLSQIIHQLPCEACTCTDDSQNVFPNLFYHFRSCNFPNHYGNNLNCLWYFTAEPNNRVEVTLLNVTTAFSDCIYLYEGHGTGGAQITQQCGHIPAAIPPFRSTGNMMTVLFQTDASITDIGFTAQATAIAPTCYGDVTFIVETSELMQNAGVELEKKAMIGMVNRFEQLNPGIVSQNQMHIAVVHFSDQHNIGNSAVLFNLNLGFPAQFVTHNIRTGIDWNATHGLTNLRLGLELANTQVLVPGQDRPQKPNIVVLLAEGFWDTKRSAFPPPFDQADIMRQKATIYALGSGPELNRANLERITGAQDQVYDLNAYMTLADRIAQSLASGAACGTHPTQPCQGVDLSALVYDIIVILDSSAGIGPTNYILVRTALQTFVGSGYSVTLGHDKAQFGFMTLSSAVTPLFLLSTFNSVADVAGAIGLATYDGSTGFDLNAALTSVKNLYMTAGGGYRPTANHLLVVVGGSSVTGTNPVPLAGQLRQQGLNIVSMGVGANADMATLQAVAGGASCAFHVNNAADIVTAITRLQGYTCQNTHC